MKVREILDATGMSLSSGISILNDHMDKEMLSAIWVPRLVLIDNWPNRVAISKVYLA